MVKTSRLTGSSSPRSRFVALMASAATILTSSQALAQSPPPADSEPGHSSAMPSPTQGYTSQAFASPAAPVPPPSTGGKSHVGVGYKIGNGLGYLGGDVIISPLPHVALDLQAGWFPAGTKHGATAFGVAPNLRIFLNEGGRSTPYLSVGYVHFWLTFDQGDKASGRGVSSHLGYEWKWPSGLAILLGGGIIYQGNVSTAANRMILGEDGVRFSLESGIRYMFL